MAAKTATIEQTQNCIEAFAQQRRDLDDLCLKVIRKCAEMSATAEYVEQAGDKVLLDEKNKALVHAMTGELVDLIGELG